MTTPEAEIHDGGEEPLPDPEMPAEGTPVLLTSAVLAESADGLQVVLPSGTRVTFQGDAGDESYEVSCAVILHAWVRSDEFGPIDSGEAE